MKTCGSCGASNLDDAQFCATCGTSLAPVAAPAPVPQAPAPVAPPMMASPATQPPAYAPPVAQPPAYAPPAGQAPQAYPPQQPYYGAPAPAPAAPRKTNWMPLVWGLVVVAVVVGGYFAYNTFLKPPLSAAEYKTQALAALDEIETAGSGMSDVFSSLSAPDASAKAAFDSAAGTIRASMAKLRGLKPPAEYQSIHARLLKGLDVYDQLLNTISAALGSGGDLTAAVSTLTNSESISATMEDFEAAREELESGSGSGQ